jgi:hypothetical protein
MLTALPNWRRLLAAGVGSIVLLLCVGFALDTRGFAGNVLAEVAGMVGSVLLALLLVDRLVAADRQARWRTVADQSSETLRWGIVRAGLALYLCLPAPRPTAADPYIGNELDALGEALRALSEALQEHAANPFAAPVSPVDVHASVTPSFRVISEVVLPRLLMIGVGPDIAAPVVKLEGSIGRLEYDVWLSDAFGLPTSALYDDLAAIAHDLSVVAASIDRLSEPSPN